MVMSLAVGPLGLVVVVLLAVGGIILVVVDSLAPPPASSQSSKHQQPRNPQAEFATKDPGTESAPEHHGYGFDWKLLPEHPAAELKTKDPAAKFPLKDRAQLRSAAVCSPAGSSPGVRRGRGSYPQPPPPLTLRMMWSRFKMKLVLWAMTWLRRMMLEVLPPEALVWGLAAIGGASKALYVAAVLRVSDTLRDGPLTPEEIAERTVGGRCDAGQLRRLLRFLAALGVYEEEVKEGTFGLTPSGVFLLSGHDRSALPVIETINDPNDHQLGWAGLVDAVRFGGSGFQHHSGREIWDAYDASPELSRRFDATMRVTAQVDYLSLAADYPWKKIRSVVDVGGGAGGLARVLVQHWPHLRGHVTVMERPAVVRYHVAPTSMEEPKPTAGGEATSADPPSTAELASRRTRGQACASAAALLPPERVEVAKGLPAEYPLADRLPAARLSAEGLSVSGEVRPAWETVTRCPYSQEQTVQLGAAEPTVRTDSAGRTDRSEIADQALQSATARRAVASDIAGRAVRTDTPERAVRTATAERAVRTDTPEREARENLAFADHEADARDTAGSLGFSFVEGDMLEEIKPAGGDAYVLQRIIHDWEDASAARILGNVAHAMTSTSVLLIVDVVLSGPLDPLHTVKAAMDVNMMACTTGRERSADELKRLLKGAGLELVRVQPLRSFQSVAEARLAPTYE